jgi:hypothetical protein
MNNFPYGAALDQLELEYAAMTGDSNPPKQSIPLAAIEHDGSLRRYVNVMGAKLSDGTFGSKTVFVDELENRTAGAVSHFGADGELLYSLPASLVTPLRCGLMGGARAALPRHGGCPQGHRDRPRRAGRGDLQHPLAAAPRAGDRAPAQRRRPPHLQERAPPAAWQQDRLLGPAPLEEWPKLARPIHPNRYFGGGVYRCRRGRSSSTFSGISDIS